MVDNNKWGTPLVPVLKGNGTIRICGDYKTTINKYLKDVKHPLPRIEEMFVTLQGGKTFSKINLKNAYNQLLDDETSKLLTWSTHKGKYLVKPLPYGTKPACAVFQKIIEKVLLGLNGTMNFLYDVIVTGATDKEHTNNLENALVKLGEAVFKINLKKCEFFKREICYLGHIINEHGLKKDLTKVETILKPPRPSNVHGVRAVVGMINYYYNFVQNLSGLMSPLYELLKKEKDFKWSKECEEAFIKAKERIASDDVLTHYDPSLQLKLSCDASNLGIGAVLSCVLASGEERPVTFISRVLNKAEKNYSVIFKEALAIFWAVRKLSQYLLG